MNALSLRANRDSAPSTGEFAAARIARHWRSTWLISSIQTLRARGHYDAYVRLLPHEHREAILFAVAGVWLPTGLARVHYEACEALDLPHGEQIAMGRAVGERAQGTVLQTAVKMATGAGVTPWTILPQLQRLWDRGADGGVCTTRKLGPKEALIETVGCELFDVPYFRCAFGGVVAGIVQLFCRRTYVHDATRAEQHSACALRLQWA